MLSIPKSRLTKQVKRKIDPSDEHVAQESWNKKKKAAPSTHFSGNYLKRLDSRNRTGKNTSKAQKLSVKDKN